MPAVVILMVFLLTPFLAEYFDAWFLCWGIATVIIGYETWVLTLKKSAKDRQEELRRIEEARARLEQIKEEASRSLMQPRKGGGALVLKDVNNMSEEELALAARKIVEELKRKKSMEAPNEPKNRKAA